MSKLRFRLWRNPSPLAADDPPVISGPSSTVQTPAPACTTDDPLGKDQITVAQAEALQCADALQEIYLLAAPGLSPASPLHRRAQMARDIVLAHAGLNAATHPELVRPWAALPPPDSKTSQTSPTTEPKKKIIPYFMG